MSIINKRIKSVKLLMVKLPLLLPTLLKKRALSRSDRLYRGQLLTRLSKKLTTMSKLSKKIPEKNKKSKKKKALLNTARARKSLKKSILQTVILRGQDAENISRRRDTTMNKKRLTLRTNFRKNHTRNLGESRVQTIRAKKTKR